MSTTTISLALDESQWQFVRERATASGEADPARYIRRLLDEEQKRQAEANLSDLLLAGIQSPVAPLTKNDWDTIRCEAREELARAKGT